MTLPVEMAANIDLPQIVCIIIIIGSQVMEVLTPPEREMLAQVKARLKNLYSSEIGLDETMFLLQLYQRYRMPNK